MKFSELIGMSLVSVKNIDDEEIVFTNDKGEMYLLTHSQD